MASKIFTTLLLSFTLCFAPSLVAGASARIELTEIETPVIKIEQTNGTLIVTGAAGKTLKIYNLTGVEVMVVRIDSQEKHIDISKLIKGVYPVKVGSISKKLNVNGK